MISATITPANASGSTAFDCAPYPGKFGKRWNKAVAAAVYKFDEPTA
jgi:hypothetical protein